MANLIDPGLPVEHPRGKYVTNLIQRQCMTWYSSTLTLRELLVQVLEVVGIDFHDLKFDDLGFAGNDDVMVAGLHGPRGVIISVWDRFGETSMLDRVYQSETDRIQSELSRGEYRGHHSRAVAAIMNGETVGGFGFSNPEVFDFINTAEVVSVYDVWAFNNGLAEQGFTM